MKYQILIITLILITSNCSVVESNTKSSTNQNNNEEYTINGHFLVGKVYVPIDNNGTKLPFTLHVQRHMRNSESNNKDDKFTSDQLTLEDGRTPQMVYNEMKMKWKTFYQDMVSKGMPPSEIRRMLSGITGETEKSGVWVVTGLNAAGYTGAQSTITCSPSTTLWTIAHESTHGWQWNIVEELNGIQEGILFQDLFTIWANYVYHTRKNDPENLEGESSDKSWELSYLDYSLQNDAEWLANTFAGWMYSPDKFLEPTWEAMKKNAPDFEAFFNFLWKDGLSVQKSYELAIGENGIKHPQYLPFEEDVFPRVDGFSLEDSKAIWKVCMKANDSDNYIDHFDSIVHSIAPDLPGSPAENYSLGYGDANHDGTTDWIGAYTGKGPIGLGNGKYLWNKENKVGAFTFIISGKKGNNYAEYKQDPYLTLPSMGGGALAQPWFREWQGKYGSCNGASLFAYRNDVWVKEYLKDLNLDVNWIRRISKPN